MTDIISGLRLIVLSGKSRHRKLRRLRFFVGGFCLLFLSAFTVFATAVYNVAIARSNTEILINVVIILFISEIDEQFFRGIQAASPRWVENLRWKKNNKDDDVQDRLHELDARLRNTEQRVVSINAVHKKMSVRGILFWKIYTVVLTQQKCRMIGHCNKLNRNVGLKSHKAPLLHICSS